MDPHNRHRAAQLQVHQFNIRKLFLVFVIITLWVGVNGVLDMLLDILFVDANVYIKLGYYLLLSIFGTIMVYYLNVSPALIM